MKMIQKDTGLAQQQAQMQNANQTDSMVTEVVMLLQQGISPQELIQMGIPVEVIEAAMESVRSKMQLPSEGQGLAEVMA